MCTKEEKLIFDICVILHPLVVARKGKSEDAADLALHYATALFLVCKDSFVGLTKEEKEAIKSLKDFLAKKKEEFAEYCKNEEDEK